jgi:hypothetical protein
MPAFSLLSAQGEALAEGDVHVLPH